MTDGSSSRMSKSEAEMGKALAVMETKMDELRRDLERLEGATGENSVQLSEAAAKAGEALSTARRALDEVRRQIEPTSQPIPINTGPHPVQPSGRGRDATVGGIAATAGAVLYAVIELIIRSLSS